MDMNVDEFQESIRDIVIHIRQLNNESVNVDRMEYRTCWRMIDIVCVLLEAGFQDYRQVARDRGLVEWKAENLSSLVHLRAKETQLRDVNWAYKILLAENVPHCIDPRWEFPM